MEQRPEEQKEKEYVIRFRMPKIPRLFRDETRDHLRAARRETLLAIRSVLDAAIESLESKTRPEGKGPTKIEVE